MPLHMSRMSYFPESSQWTRKITCHKKTWQVWQTAEPWDVWVYPRGGEVISTVRQHWLLWTLQVLAGQRGAKLLLSPVGSQEKCQWLDFSPVKFILDTQLLGLKIIISMWCLKTSRGWRESSVVVFSHTRSWVQFPVIKKEPGVELTYDVSNRKLTLALQETEVTLARCMSGLHIYPCSVLTAWIYMYHMRASYPEVRKGHEIPWNCSYRWLWTSPPPRIPI